MFRMTAMDHIVLNVEDMDTVLDFYVNVLGLEPERLEEFRQGKVGFPSVRISANTVIDLFPLKEPVPATAVPLRTDLNHFCLVVDKEDMPGFIDHLKAHGVTIEEGPGQRWGARGTGISIYFSDPEKRRIEVRYYDN
jgi:catechol 2,3-dioxygenase-like lactoylglutathione lyase family enzyme